MVQIDCYRQVLFRGNLNSWPLVTIWHCCNTLLLLLKLQSHPSPQATALSRHPSRSGAKACMRGNSHIQKTPHAHHRHTLSHRATPATYLYYITHATAYPSTSRSALHSATDGDSSPELARCKSITAMNLSWEDWLQTRGHVLWAADAKWPLAVLTG